MNDEREALKALLWDVDSRNRTWNTTLMFSTGGLHSLRSLLSYSGPDVYLFGEIANTEYPWKA